MSDPVIPLLNSRGGTITCRRGDPNPNKVTLVVNFGDGDSTKTAAFSLEQLTTLTSDGVRTRGQGGTAFRNTHQMSYGDVVELNFDGPGCDLAIVRTREFANGARVSI